MGKPIGQVGAGGGASKVWGPVTEYTRNLRLTGYIIGSASEIFDSNLLIKFKEITQPIIFPHGYDEAGGPGPVIQIDEIPKFRTIFSDIVPGKEYNRHFPGLQAEVDAHNAANPSIIDQRSLWTVADDVRWRSRPFYDLKIGTDVVAIADNCWEDDFEIGPTTRFAGGGDISIGKSAFKSFGIARGNVFKNMKYLLIQDKSFYAASCGSVNLIECTVENATEAFRTADLKNGDFIMTACKGSEIPDFFAAEAQNLIGISIDMEGEATIGERAFNSCRAENLYIWDGCTSIGEHAFSNNNFRYAIDVLPPSIIEYGNSCFKDSNIKTLLIDPDGAALFKQWSFGQNSIENPYVFLKGSFLRNSFRSAFNQTKEGDIVHIAQGLVQGQNGSILGKLAFSYNAMNSVICEATIEADGAFYESSIRNATIKNYIYGRHTFYRSVQSYPDFVVTDTSFLEGSYRTFQQDSNGFGAINPSPPCSSIVYYPVDLSSVVGDGFEPDPETRLDWDALRDKFAFSREEAIAFSEANPGLTIEWMTCAPYSITVGIGQGDNYWEETLVRDDPAPIPGTSSTIYPLPYYYKQVEGGGGALDQWVLDVRYHPWGYEKISLMGDWELTGGVGPGYDYIGYSTAGSLLLSEGEGFWDINATRAPGYGPEAAGITFARTSNCTIQGSLLNPMDGANRSVNTDAHPDETATFVSYVPGISNPLNEFANLMTRKQRPWLQQLEEFVINGDVKEFPWYVSKLYVPSSDVDSLQANSHFRNKHMFDGEILPIPE